MANPPVDLEAVARLVDQLEADLARVRQGEAGAETLRAEVEQLRTLLAGDAPVPADVHAGLSGLQLTLHQLSDELPADLVKSGDYLTRIGRLLGI